MPLYTTIHLHNVHPENESSFALWFDGPHRESLARLRGFKSADRYTVAAHQIMPDIPQPWRFLSVYDFDLPSPEIDIPALGPLLAEARDAGITAADDAERIYTYRLYSDWRGSPNWQKQQPFSGISLILANYVAGHEAEYQKW